MPDSVGGLPQAQPSRAPNLHRAQAARHFPSTRHTPVKSTFFNLRYTPRTSVQMPALRLAQRFAAWFAPCIIAAALVTYSVSARADMFDESVSLWVRTIDTNRDGGVSRDELSAAIAQRGASAPTDPSSQALHMLLRAFPLIDSNRDGRLSVAEISAGISTRFANADRNNNGSLTLSEATDGMPMVARNFSAIDTRGSGRVTLVEVRAFLAQAMRHSLNATAMR
jgi:Ca2+-binding EF-hand superfamily protein